MYLKSNLAIATAAAIALSVAALAGGVTSTATTAGDSATTTFHAAEAWAFPESHSPDPGVPKSSHAPKPDPYEIVHIAGSIRTYTVGQLDAGSPDWFPQDHPPPPRIVSEGHKPASRCAECHLINGTGVPATASLAGLPKAYILEQVSAFRAGERGMGGLVTAHDMLDEARALTPVDLQQAAAYFSATKFVSGVRVVETATVPKMHWKYYVQVPDKGDAREPIGQRIIETPVNFEDYQYLTGRTAYIAHVPPGSIERGALIAAKGKGAVPSCESCHGANLQGVGAIPPLAGRSPTYIARELILFRTGKRMNAGAAPMRVEVAHLTLKDMIDVAAYAASLKD